MEQLIQMLRQAFANNFTLYLKSHNYHWCISGPDFPEYHAFLEEIYDAFQDAIDMYAEKMRQIGAYPQGDYRDIVANTQINDPVDTITDYSTIFQNLLDDMDIQITQLKDTYNAADLAGEYGIENFLAERIDEIRQFQWKIQAILGGE
jgi:starvation-inducible DNA-binding protein